VLGSASLPPSASSWFDTQIRPYLRTKAAPSAVWTDIASLGEARTIDAAERWLEENWGAPPRVAATLLASWTAGYVSAAIALGALREGVVVHLDRARVEVRLQEGGPPVDLRLHQAPVSVAREQVAAPPGASSSNDLEADAIAVINRLCEPWIEALARRSGRGVAGLWAQVADDVGRVAVLLDDPVRDVSRVERLLATPGARWRTKPRFWRAATENKSRLIQHRGSCCLWYRCEVAQRPSSPAEQAGPQYCTACLFRSSADVEARTLGSATA
jgi:hypothetical protein